MLIIGAGGAGCAAAIEADNAGASVLMATKLRLGDANTMMAEGGIQGATKPNDSPAQHFLDAYGGGHYLGKKELVYKLVTEAPDCFQWLNDLGVEFDKEEDGTLIAIHGGTSRNVCMRRRTTPAPRSCGTLRDETRWRRIPCLNYAARIELLRDEAATPAAPCSSTPTRRSPGSSVPRPPSSRPVVRADCTSRASTSNHHGATARSRLAYRVGALFCSPTP